ncbi:MAG: hypothetical protein KKG09_00455 [Verrucomicrobia bacterium]|nr:hypothetical protein [Verrucomicrobiota bacterium]MBU4430276.1 hypothetical protein [Verrucomicrobiota bacterium]MBU4496462.1 hypothetical protein [Verrucomicrobiota bacterium]MCG2679674.1 hypothetical protein [Kiritimatiellia bacterium]
MSRKILSLIGMAIVMTAASECSGQEAVSDAKQPASRITAAPQDSGSPEKIKGPAWLAEGPIYNVSASYYKGGLSELVRWVPHLKETGIRTIYLMTIWSDNSYTPDDYFKISPNCGTEDDLKALVRAVHEHDMKILLDLVTGYSNGKPENVIHTRHPEWHLKDKDGRIPRFHPNRWGPAIDRSNPEVIKYFAEVAKHYVEKFDIDGWRIDAPQNNYSPKVIDGDHSATELLRQVKRAITSVKADAVLLVELPGPTCEGNLAAEPLFDEMCEASYDWFLIGQTQVKDDNSDAVPKEIKEAFLRLKQRYGGGEKPCPADVDVRRISAWAKEEFGIEIKSRRDLRKVQAQLLVKNGSPRGFADEILKGKATSTDLVNFFRDETILHHRTRVRWFENHDTHARAMRVYRDQWKNLLVLISTVPGVPMIHAGQETGELEADRFSRKIDEGTKGYFRKVFSIRSAHPALRRGSISNAWRSGDPAFAYVRGVAEEKVVVALNFNKEPAVCTVHVPFAGEARDELSEETFRVTKSEDLELTVPAFGARILAAKR